MHKRTFVEIFLEALFFRGAKPQKIRCDNGPGYVSEALKEWAERRGADEYVGGPHAQLEDRVDGVGQLMVVDKRAAPAVDSQFLGAVSNGTIVLLQADRIEQFRQQFREARVS